MKVKITYTTVPWRRHHDIIMCNVVEILIVGCIITISVDMSIHYTHTLRFKSITSKLNLSAFTIL